MAEKVKIVRPCSSAGPGGQVLAHAIGEVVELPQSICDSLTRGGLAQFTTKSDEDAFFDRETIRKHSHKTDYELSQHRPHVI